MTLVEGTFPVKDNVIVEYEVSTKKANFVEDDVMATKKYGSCYKKVMKYNAPPPSVLRVLLQRNQVIFLTRRGENNT